MEVDHIFVGLNAMLFVVIITTALMLGYVFRRYQYHYLPDSAVSMILGFFIGLIMNLFDQGNQNEESLFIMFKPEIFFFIILPPIILDAGYTLKKANFFHNIFPILMYAVIGTFISTVFIGYGLSALAKWGWVPLDGDNLLECLTFASLISAVDPVATLSILGAPNINASPLLYSLVFGESVLNDAVSIVLFNTFRSFDCAEFTNDDIFRATLSFLTVFVGSLCLGVAVALFCSFIFKNSNLQAEPVYEILLITMFAYSSYCLAEILALSGITSLFFCGIVLSHYAWHSISPISRMCTHYTFKGIALASETFLFAYLGITAVLSSRKVFHLEWSLSLIFFTMLLCLLSRALHIFPISFLVNATRPNTRKISLAMQTVMWFAGLRGAIAFALALNMFSQHRAVIITTTMSIVIFTTVVCGGLTAPLVERLGLKRQKRRKSEAAGLAAVQMAVLPSNFHDADYNSRTPKGRSLFGGGGGKRGGGGHEDNSQSHGQIHSQGKSSSDNSSGGHCSGNSNNRGLFVEPVAPRSRHNSLSAISVADDSGMEGMGSKKSNVGGGMNNNSSHNRGGINGNEEADSDNSDDSMGLQRNGSGGSDSDSTDIRSGVTKSNHHHHADENDQKFRRTHSASHHSHHTRLHPSPGTSGHSLSTTPRAHIHTQALAPQSPSITSLLSPPRKRSESSLIQTWHAFDHRFMRRHFGGSSTHGQYIDVSQKSDEGEN